LKIVKTITGIVIPFLAFSLCLGQPEQTDAQSLGEAFNAGAPDVEPVVVGRERWNEKKPTTEIPTQKNTPEPANSEKTQPSTITELDPLETKQIKPEPTELPLEAPRIKPAVNIVRNFEGKLVFKPRKFGFENDYPYQLANSRGKRLAYVDVGNLKAIDPKKFVDKQINVLGKLVPIKEGSDDMVIRARVLRSSN